MVCRFNMHGHRLVMHGHRFEGRFGNDLDRGFPGRRHLHRRSFDSVLLHGRCWHINRHCLDRRHLLLLRNGALGTRTAIPSATTAPTPPPFGVLFVRPLGTGRPIVTLGARWTLGSLLPPVARFTFSARPYSVRCATRALLGYRLVLRSAFAVALARPLGPSGLLSAALAECAVPATTVPAIPLATQCFVLGRARFDLDRLLCRLGLGSQPTEDF